MHATASRRPGLQGRCHEETADEALWEAGILPCGGWGNISEEKRDDGLGLGASMVHSGEGCGGNFVVVLIEKRGKGPKRNVFFYGSSRIARITEIAASSFSSLVVHFSELILGSYIGI